MICTIRASGKASTRPSAQYMRSGLASPYLRMSRSAMQVPLPFSSLASRQAWEQAMQPCGVTCQACANASRSTVAAASPRPRWMDGLRANAYTTLITLRWPTVTWKPGGLLQRARQEVRSRMRGADDEDRLADLAAVDDQNVGTRCHD